MITNATKLQEVIEELADLPLDARRAHLADVEEKQGVAAAQQLRDGLTEFWKRKG